ncbi:MAG: hypothetical protein K8S18_14170 [Desulfobacula sp.]|nr:hypothetical protein [Desulfobacula sp.]
MKVRNPFRIRFSENIVSDSEFLSLFEPGALDALPKDGIWEGVKIFRSAPGGGKTSLFKIFTPNALRTLYALRAIEDNKELYKYLEKIGTISESGPLVLGIYLSCSRVYANLEDLSFDRGKKNRIFYSLLNARIVLAALKGALSLRDLTYPDDLEKLQISAPTDSDISNIIPVPCSGIELYTWASSIEKNVFSVIDSFSSTDDNLLIGHDDLYGLFILRPNSITFNGNPISRHTLVLLDDVHELTSIQRKNLFNMVTSIRLPIGIWLAERLEALTPEELLSTNAIEGREYDLINLEDFWKNNNRFKNVLINIADIRAKWSDSQIYSFAGHLENSLDNEEWSDQYLEAIQIISERVLKKVASQKKYDDWISTQMEFQGTPLECATSWRAFEIIIERDKKKGQKTFNDIFDQPIHEDELIKQEENSKTRSAAEFFLSKEFKLPYYFGISQINKIASLNIEQFLAFAGDLFEEMISAEIIKESPILKPERQEKILQNVARQRWYEIPRRVSNGRDVVNLLESIKELAVWETNRPSVPYGPGVTGIGISTIEYEKLINLGARKKNPKYYRLVKTISSAISHNLLELHPNIKQGGKEWVVLYLNRMLCLHFGLPLQFGGWRGNSIDEICKWLDVGFKLTKK